MCKTELGCFEYRTGHVVRDLGILAFCSQWVNDLIHTANYVLIITRLGSVRWKPACNISVTEPEQV